MGKLPPDDMLRPADQEALDYAAAYVNVCPDPVGISEIASRHKTTPGTIRSWRKRHDTFPEPIAELKMGPVFDWREVESWLKTRRSQ
jgi:hypothetical protein